MLKEATYKDKFALLKDWMPILFDSVKKDLRNDHLRQDPSFIKKYFSNKNLNKITTEELIEGYLNAIEDGGEKVAEYITNRWLLKNAEIYNLFEEELTKVNPNFNELVELDRAKSMEIVEKSERQFGAPNTYLFAVLNSVVFPNEVYQHLAQRAKQKSEQQKSEDCDLAEKQTLDSLKRNHDREIARLTDKYEKKISGMVKKYTCDVDALKKQVSSLQRKLQGNPVAAE